MPNTRLAYRYAKSLLDFAIEKGQVDQVLSDMQWLQAVCAQSKDFTNLLRSPIIKSDVKRKITEAVTTGNIGEITTLFNRLLISKGRESHLPDIIDAFITAYKEYKNIHTLKLTTAAPINDALKQAIVKQVKQTGGYENIELEESINEDLIGGFVLQVGDKLIDASIAYDLKTIATQFKNNDFIYKLR